MHALKLLLVAAAVVAQSARAASVDESLAAANAAGVSLSEAIRAAAAAAAQSDSAVAVQGVQNCYNKCQNMFNNQAYSGNVAGTDTYEYSACRVGCAICNAVITANDTDTSKCFTVCKNTNWLDNKDESGKAFPIVKGVIEPDKACEFGCVINTCQYVCQGGTPDNAPNAANANLWWGSGGCSIKTGATRPGGFYSQNGQYNFYNQPAGAAGQAECCSNAFSLCRYSGNKNSQNYKDVLGQAQVYCKNVAGAGQTATSICNFFKNPSNCGNNL